MDEQITRETANLIIAKNLYGEKSVGIFCGEVRILDGLNSIDCCHTFDVFNEDFSDAWKALKKWRSFSRNRYASIDCIFDRFVVSLETGDQHDHITQGSGSDDNECVAVAKALLSVFVGYPAPEIKEV